jgi:hypothetical protein
MKFKVMLTHIKQYCAGVNISRCESSVLAEFDTLDEAEQAIEAVGDTNKDWAKAISESRGHLTDAEFVRAVRLYRRSDHSN